VAASRINKYLSVGGGFSVVYSNYEAKMAIRNLEPGGGGLEFDDYLD